jgi:hypothetical protein
LESHVKALGVLCILVGGFGGLAAIFYFELFAGPAASSSYGPLIGYIVNGWMLLLLILTIPCVALGIGLVNFRPWTRPIGTIVAILELLNFPIGTALGIYALCILMSAEADQLFTPRFKHPR